jgi:hypothetical protein
MRRKRKRRTKRRSKSLPPAATNAYKPSPDRSKKGPPGKDGHNSKEQRRSKATKIGKRTELYKEKNRKGSVTKWRVIVGSNESKRTVIRRWVVFLS